MGVVTLHYFSVVRSGELLERLRINEGYKHPVPLVWQALLGVPRPVSHALPFISPLGAPQSSRAGRLGWGQGWEDSSTGSQHEGLSTWL